MRGDDDERDAEDLSLSSLECCSWSSRCASPESVASKTLIASPSHLTALLGATTCSTPRRSPRAKKPPPSRFMFGSVDKSTVATEHEHSSPHATVECRIGSYLRLPTEVRFECTWCNSVRPPLDTLGVSTLSRSEQRLWILEYLSTNCPNVGVSGPKDAKGIVFLICGNRVCQTLWLNALPLCSSRFYSIRSEFLGGVTKSSAVLQRRRGMTNGSLLPGSWRQTAR